MQLVAEAVQGRMHSLDEHERQELGGVEYRALGLLIVLLPVYLIGWIVIGSAMLVPYSYRTYVTNVVSSSQPGNLIPGWSAIHVSMQQVLVR